MTRSIAILWGAATILLLLASPWAATLAGVLWACPFKTLTGWPCPTCGAGRAAVLLADLDVTSALMRYPLPTLGWLAFLGGGLVAMAWALSHRELPRLPSRVPLWVRIPLVGFVLACWVYSIVTGV